MDKEFKISRLEKCDVDQAIELAVSCFGEKTREEVVYETKTSFSDNYYKPFIYVAKCNSEVIGLIMGHEMGFYPNIQSLSWLCVKEDHREYNLGRKLIKHAEEDTVKNIWKNKSGTFIGVSVIGKKYHKELGYEYHGNTHDEYPFIIKKYIADK